SLATTNYQTPLTTDHQVKLSGLLPSTKYYYSIGTSAGPLVGGNSTYYFFTSPRIGKAKPTRIWVIGDSGTANNKARAVRDAYLSSTRTRRTDLGLVRDDNTT